MKTVKTRSVVPPIVQIVALVVLAIILLIAMP